MNTSTSALYNTVPQELSEQYARRLGYDPNMILCSAFKPERVFYHVCLAEVMNHFFIDTLDEMQRSQIIADIADRIYEAGLNSFMHKQQREMDRFEKEEMPEIKKLMLAMRASLPRDGFDKDLFDQNWSLTDKYDPAWRRLAYNAFRDAHVAPGYPAKAGDTNVEELVTSFVDMRYRHLARWEIAQQQISAYLEEHKEEIKRQYPVRSMQRIDAQNRNMVSFLGGMGSGKSTMMRKWWETHRQQYPADSFLVLDADYLKIALARSAKTVVNAVHEESSAVITYLSNLLAADTKNNRPTYNILFASRALKGIREKNAFAGNTHSEFYFLEAADAVTIESARRRNTGTGRTVTDQKVIISCQDAAWTIIKICGGYKKANSHLYIYYRTDVDTAPKCVGAIDLQKGEVLIEDKKAFNAACNRIFDTPFGKISINDMLKKMEYKKHYRPQGKSWKETAAASRALPHSFGSLQ